jgi:hypothetical protein
MRGGGGGVLGYELRLLTSTTGACHRELLGLIIPFLSSYSTCRSISFF